TAHGEPQLVANDAHGRGEHGEGTRLEGALDGTRVADIDERVGDPTRAHLLEARPEIDRRHVDRRQRATQRQRDRAADETESEDAQPSHAYRVCVLSPDSG